MELLWAVNELIGSHEVKNWLEHSKCYIRISCYNYVSLYIFLIPGDLKYCFFVSRMQELNKGNRNSQL